MERMVYSASPINLWRCVYSYGEKNQSVRPLRNRPRSCFDLDFCCTKSNRLDFVVMVVGTKSDLAYVSVFRRYFFCHLSRWTNCQREMVNSSLRYSSLTGLGAPYAPTRSCPKRTRIFKNWKFAAAGRFLIFRITEKPEPQSCFSQRFWFFVIWSK